MRTLLATIVTAALILSTVADATLAGAPDEEIKKLQAQVQELQAKLAAQQDQINRLQQQLADGNSRFAQLQRELAVKDARIAKLQALVDKAAAEQPKVEAPNVETPAGPAAGGLSEKERDYIAEAQRQRQAALKEAGRQIIELAAYMTRIVQGNVEANSSGVVVDARTGAFTFQTAQQKAERIRQTQERINALNKRLDELKRNEPPFVPALRGGFAVGKVGRFGYPVTVRQILDKENMIVEAAVAVTAEGGTIWAVQKLNVWVAKTLTANLVDDVEVELTAPFEITGTRPYRTPAGTGKTVFVATPFDARRADQAMPQAK